MTLIKGMWYSDSGGFMSACTPDCSNCAELVADRAAMVELQCQLNALVDQMEGCLEARQPMSAALGQQLHDLRRRAEFLFRTANQF